MTEPHAVEAFAELLAKYDYALPSAAIAQRPAKPRDAARLLILDRVGGARRHGRFRDLPEHLAPGDLLVLNDTRVIPARLRGRKLPGGGVAEVFLVQPRGAETWEALLKMSGSRRAGQQIALRGDDRAELVRPLAGGSWEVRLTGPGGVTAFLERSGEVPLPPYIQRAPEASDRDAYQTVFAAQPGAVAAPTAGLHFTPELLARLATAGIRQARVTLHVGPGTFQPLRPEEWAAGRLHPETYTLPVATARAVAVARAAGRRVVAVGTTSARVLETRATGQRLVTAGTGRTRLFLRPPDAVRVVDGLITNFHLPRTSLLMLVAAFAGREPVLAAYAEALARGYRFYSYGDAMLIQ